MNEDIIIRKSSALYARYGIKSVSVDDISFMLGISKKTLYEFIENKNVLIQKIVESNIHMFYEKVAMAANQEEDLFYGLCKMYLSIIKEIKKINPSYVHDLKKYHHREYQKIMDFRNDRLYFLITDYIKRGVAKGIFRDDIEIKYVYFNQINKISILILDSVTECPETIPVQEIYKLILNDIRGITTLEGHRKFDENYEMLLQLK